MPVVHPLVALWIKIFKPCAEHANCLAAHIQCRLMGCTVNAQRKAAGDDKTGARQTARNAAAVSMPGRDARRLPTIASCGFSRIEGSPATNNSGGASSIWASSAG
jgi:hypothetical protein